MNQLFNDQQIDPRLNSIINRIQSTGYEVLRGRYVRYKVKQIFVKVTISKPRKVNIFEEFILSTAIDITPSVMVEDLAIVLGIDPMFLRSVTTNLQSLKLLESTSDSTLRVTPFGQQLFQNQNSVLATYCTENIYIIIDPLANEQIAFNYARLPEVPLDLTTLSSLIDEYFNLSSFGRENIQDFIDNYNAKNINRSNSFITGYQELSDLKSVRKEVSIYYAVDSQKHQIIKVFNGEQELESASHRLTDILNTENSLEIAWESLFSLSDEEIQQANTDLNTFYSVSSVLDEESEIAYSSAIRILPSISRNNTYDAEEIQFFVSQKQIKQIVHLTRLCNLQNICQKGAILSLYHLQKNKSQFQPFDGKKPEGQRYKNHVNCSVSYYNFFMLYGLVYKSSEPVILLYIKPDYFWKEGTEFCRFNAATEGGRHVAPGFRTLQSLYDDTILDRQGLQDRYNKPMNLPTCIQAEVLIRDGIPLEDIMEIVIRSWSDELRVREAGWQGNIRISPHDFEWHSDWIVSKGSARNF